jgi:hypothetical protein
LTPDLEVVVRFAVDVEAAGFTAVDFAAVDFVAPDFAFEV